MNKIRVLCVTDYYLPGNKAGGPIRTIANMSDILAGEVEFGIVTRDRDLGDDAPFHGIRVNEWQEVGSAQVFYASPESFGASAVERTFDNHDMLYLNSFFSYRGSICPNFKFRNRVKILIAPRGEFSQGALALKSLKKRAFLKLAKLTGLYRDVHWHASSAMEAEDIARIFPGAKEKTHLAIDPVIVGEAVPVPSLPEISAELKIVFISRISPMKNLDGLIDLLTEIDEPVLLTIFGPIEDNEYWHLCQRKIANLPNNVQTIYSGTLRPDDVSLKFAEHDLFAFPTHGENFGHVIFESLRAGTPVLLSDQTPWVADATGAVTVAPLNSPDIWRAEIRKAAHRTSKESQNIRMSSLAYARSHAENDETRFDNLRMFLSIAERLDT
jgi:glycosyltransferase involved in cell wall biosynthesis